MIKLNIDNLCVIDLSEVRGAVKMEHILDGNNRALLELKEYIEVERPLQKGDTLFTPGDLIEHLYVVLSGKIVISQPIMDGRELTLRLCKPGDLIGDSTLFANHGKKHVLHAAAFRECVVGCIHRETLDEIVADHIGLARFLMNEISENALRDNMKLVDLVMYGRRGALFSTLIRLSNSYGVMKKGDIFINLALTNQELANFCGTTRESINRLLRELRDKKIISVENKYITIHNLDYLKEVLNCDTCPVTLCSIH